MGYMVAIEHFHGPLDLLLYLIEKNEVDIYHIPVALVADQYIQYLHEQRSADLENISDFLIMASYLLYLKAKALLPSGQIHDPGLEEDPEDPQKELGRKLHQYQKYKKAAQFLMFCQNGNVSRCFFKEKQGLGMKTERVIKGQRSALIGAYQYILNRKKAITFFRNRGRHDFNLKKQQEELLKHLKNNPQGIVFQSHIQKHCPVPEVSSYFLALLELVRLKKVKVYQDRLFGDIKIVLAGDGALC